MLELLKSLEAWGSADFEVVLKNELAQKAGQLPLQQGLALSSSVAERPVTVVIHRVEEQENVICVKAGIFYQGMVGGCSCADDPTPDSENTEYCEVRLDVDKTTAATAVTLLMG